MDIEDEQKVHQPRGQKVRASVLVGRRQDRAPGALGQGARRDVEQAGPVDREGREDRQGLAGLDGVQASLDREPGKKGRGDEHEEKIVSFVPKLFL